MRDHVLVLFGLALVLGAAGCGSSEPPTGANPNAAPTAAAPPGQASAPSPQVGNLRLGGIEVGRAVNPDKTMYDATSFFVPTDKVWASVVILGSGPKAALQARFISADGEVIAQEKQDVTPNERAVAAFSAARPDGWKLGRYHVDVLLNDVAVGSRDFEVKQPPL